MALLMIFATLRLEVLFIRDPWVPHILENKRATTFLLLLVHGSIMAGINGGWEKW